jgi:2-polyprenyl-6-methoxyphenol hydroxylase-like FAD-dependent oxidoreductase
MRKILIVGSGQSGLQLGLGLLKHGYDVTLMSARTPDEIRNGRVMSTQCMFHTSLQTERDLGLDFWEADTPSIWGLGVSVAGADGARAVDWLGHLDGYAQSVDQRVKMAGWLEAFEQQGGKLVLHGVAVSDLDRLADMYDLTVVAAGKGELVSMFGRDTRRSTFDTPQRALAVTYVHGLEMRPEHPDTYAVRFNLVPEVGELFMIPGYTTTGPCDILFFEGVPGGPLDCWADVRTPDEYLRRMLDLMATYVPWEYERARHVELTDPGGVLAGRYAPVVRHPVGRLPSGGVVLGMADVVVANDPITGQGSNNAAKCAASYLDSVLAHGDRPFDEAFMRDTFERYWSYAQYVTTWTNAMLQPPPPHVLEVIGAAGQYPEVANRFANGFDDPSDFFSWFMDPELAQTYLAEVQQRAVPA